MFTKNTAGQLNGSLGNVSNVGLIWLRVGRGGDMGWGGEGAMVGDGEGYYGWGEVDKE